MISSLSFLLGHACRISDVDSHIIFIVNVIYIYIFVIYINDSFLIRFVCSGVIGWNKYKSSQFKILNNADTTYHNMSPFPTSFPLERGQEESRIGEGESTVAPAVARSLKNIRQESTESRSTLQSCVVDERGRTILKV